MDLPFKNNLYSYQIVVHGPGGHAQLASVSEPIADYWNAVDERTFGAHLQIGKSINVSLEGSMIDPNFESKDRRIVGPEKHRNLTISVALMSGLVIWNRITVTQATSKFGIRIRNDDKFMSNGQPKPWALYRSFETLTCRYVLHIGSKFDPKFLQLQFAKFPPGYILAGMNYEGRALELTPYVGKILKPPVADIIYDLPLGLSR